MAGDWDPIREACNDLLEDRDGVALGVARRVQAELPQYAQLSVESVAAPILSSLVVAATALRDRRLPVGNEFAALRATGELRAREDIDIDGPLHALRIATSTLWEVHTRRAHELGVHYRTLLEAHEHLWRLTDLIARELTAGHRAAELVLARRAYQHRVDLVRALLLGRRDPDDVADQVVSLGIDPDHPYFVCRGRPAVTAGIADLEHALGTGWFDGAAAVVVPLEQDVIGLLPDLPGAQVPGIVGLSGPLTLAETPAGFRLATRALATALRFGLDGVHTVASLGVRAAVPTDHELGEALEERFLAPLRSGRPHDREIERTVATYLDNGLRIDDTARLLHVHPNTLRQRLRRYSELTGADLHSLPDQFGIWWALQRRKPDW